jgi:hypothetical protein
MRGRSRKQKESTKRFKNRWQRPVPYYPTKVETIEQFLARGGKIRRIEPPDVAVGSPLASLGELVGKR